MKNAGGLTGTPVLKSPHAVIIRKGARTVTSFATVMPNVEEARLASGGIHRWMPHGTKGPREQGLLSGAAG